MFDEFIALTKSVGIPSYRTPSKSEAIGCLLSLSFYKDYQATSYARTYNYYLKGELIKSDRDSVINAAIKEQEAQDNWLAYEVFRSINVEHQMDIAPDVLSLLRSTPTKYFNKECRVLRFDFMRRAIHAGCTEIFFALIPEDEGWWFELVNGDCCNTSKGSISEEEINFNFNKMTCETKPVQYLERQEVRLSASLMRRTTYWDAMLLSLSGSDVFSDRIATTLWSIKTRNSTRTHNKHAIRMACWNFRTAIFLQSNDIASLRLPILCGSDVTRVYDNKNSASNDAFNPMTFSWVQEIVNQLITKYLNRHRDRDVKYTQMVNEVEAACRSTDQGHLIGVRFYEAIKHVTRSNPSNSIYHERLQEAVINTANILSSFLDKDDVIAPHSVSEKPFLATILNESKSIRGRWLLEYSTARLPDILFWASKANTVGQLKKILVKFDATPLDVLHSVKDDKTKRLLMEIISES